MTVEKIYIGWDVGAWNCDNNRSSRDGVVILNENEDLVGKYRGNLKEIINQAETYQDFLNLLFQLCSLSYNNEYVTMAVDAPLGFSEAFVKLITEYLSFGNSIESFQDNPYLFRETERFLYAKGYKPLSAINHMIGSQSTKAIHFISKFNCSIETPGIWKSSDKRFTIIETYPAANNIESPFELYSQHKDIKDAYICASIAKIFDMDRTKLFKPEQGVKEREGWIWVLCDQ